VTFGKQARVVTAPNQTLLIGCTLAGDPLFKLVFD
jgi:hypothetical protein